MVAVAHLALARSQNTGAGILGKHERKAASIGCFFACFFYANGHSKEDANEAGECPAREVVALS